MKASRPPYAGNAKQAGWEYEQAPAAWPNHIKGLLQGKQIKIPFTFHLNIPSNVTFQFSQCLQSELQYANCKLKSGLRWVLSAI